MVSFKEAILGTEGQPARAEDLTPEEFRRLRQPVSNAFQGLIESGGGPAFSGPFAADLTPSETGFLSSIQGAGQPSAQAGQARDVFGRTLSGEFLSPDSNPFLAATIQAAQRPVVEQFQDVVMPRLRSDFTRAGQSIQQITSGPRNESGSSPFDRAAAIASRGLVNQLGDISTNIAGQNFQTERGRQLNVAAQTPQFDRQQLDQMVQGLEAVALPRLVEQLGIDRGLEEFRRRRDALMEALQSAAGISKPEAAVFQGTPGQEGALHGFAEGFGQGLGSFVGSGGSDARLKRNIRASAAPTLTDEQIRRIRAVDFEMAGQDGSGVIAQELEEIGLGDLVIRATDHDYRRVDYGGLAARLINTLQRSG